MEILVAISIAAMTASGVYLLLRSRSYSIILGLSMLTYAINMFLFASGGLAVDQAPIVRAEAIGYTDPVPQALVLTAIVINFGMTALAVVLAMRVHLETGSDDVSMSDAATDEESAK